MAKYITREIYGLAYKGEMIGDHFVAKKQDGEYAAFDRDGAIVITEKTKKEVIAELKRKLEQAQQEAETQEQDKRVQIIMLPPHRGLPTGHLIRVATIDGKLAWSKMTSSNDTYEINRERNEVILKAAQKGYRFTLFETCFTSYKNAQREFYSDPLGLVERIQKPRHNNKSTQHQDESF